MVWFKVDDGLHSHPKIEELEALSRGAHSEALALWVLAGSWCADQLTDGVVTLDRCKKLVPYSPAKAISALVSVRFWKEIRPNVFQFHSWDDRNPARAEVERRRAEDAERKRKRRNVRADSAPPSERSPVGSPLHPTIPDHTRPDQIERVSTWEPPVDEEAPSREGSSPPLVLVPPGPQEPRGAVLRVFRVWVQLHVAEGARGRARLNARRRARIQARLREGYSVDVLCAALRGATADPWIMGLDPRSPRAYRDLETLLRDGSQVERLAVLDGREMVALRGPAPASDFSGARSIEEQWETQLAADEAFRRRETKGDTKG